MWPYGSTAYRSRRQRSSVRLTHVATAVGQHRCGRSLQYTPSSILRQGFSVRGRNDQSVIGIEL